MGTFSLDGSTVQQVAVLGDSNYYITLYIASLFNIPELIPLPSGQEVFALLRLSDRLKAAQDRGKSYIDETSGVSHRLRIMANPNIPNCYSAFQSFALQATRIQGSLPLSADDKTAVLNALQTFLDAQTRLQANLGAMQNIFVAFQSGIASDNQTLDDLLNDIAPDGSVSSTVSLSNQDKQEVKQAIDDSVPNLSQDDGMAVTACAQMALSLAELADVFSIMSGKTRQLQEDLHDVQDSAFIGKLDDLSLEVALSDWQQFVAYVATIGF
jgi:hypothetical protein